MRSELQVSPMPLLILSRLSHLPLTRPFFKFAVDSGILPSIFFKRLEQDGTSSPRSWLGDLHKHL